MEVVFSDDHPRIFYSIGEFYGIGESPPSVFVAQLATYGTVLLLLQTEKSTQIAADRAAIITRYSLYIALVFQGIPSIDFVNVSCQENQHVTVQQTDG